MTGRRDLRSVRSLRIRLREAEATLAEAVDAGWADRLVRALAQIASGKEEPEGIALRALEDAGLRSVQHRLEL